MSKIKVRQQRLDCSGEQSWAHGNSLVNYMKVQNIFGNLFKTIVLAIIQ